MLQRAFCHHINVHTVTSCGKLTVFLLSYCKNGILKNHITHHFRSKEVKMCRLPQTVKVANGHLNEFASFYNWCNFHVKAAALVEAVFH